MDNKNMKGPQDSSRINVNEDYELQYWSKKFNVSADRLREVVRQVGVSANAVEQHLKGNQGKPRN
jgi:hypothetical protein